MLAHGTAAVFRGRLTTSLKGDAPSAVDHDSGTPAPATTTNVGRCHKAWTVAGRIVVCPFGIKSDELREIEYKCEECFKKLCN